MKIRSAWLAQKSGFFAMLFCLPAQLNAAEIGREYFKFA